MAGAGKRGQMDTRSPFETAPERRGSGSLKWDRPGEEDVLPLWVADMDFAVPLPVRAALRKRLDSGVFGYGMVPPGYAEAEEHWWESRHGTGIRGEWLLPCTGVIPSLAAVLSAFAGPGDRVLLQPPVYNYFYTVLKNQGYEPAENRLLCEDGRYRIDLKDFEEQASHPRTRVFFLCNPHNPVGRVWTPAELEAMAQICREHGVLVVADEIHRDLVFPGHRYTPFLALPEGIRGPHLTCTSPTKTFNLAGLRVSSILAPDPRIRATLRETLDRYELMEPNLFGIDALIAAYREGSAWLDALLPYLWENYCFLEDICRDALPRIHPIRPEATYLIWMDCRETGESGDDLWRKVLERGRVRLNPGSLYGPGGEGFLRMNIACPRGTLEEAMRRMVGALT